MTRLAAYQLRRAQLAGFATVAEWQAHIEREHRDRELAPLRAIVRGASAKGNTFTHPQLGGTR